MAKKRMSPPSLWSDPPAGPPAYMPLDRSRIVQTALRLLGESGSKELSMRKIADALQVKTASLYYHVKDKEELLQLLADHLCQAMRPVDAVLPWGEQLRQWSAAFRDALRGCRDAADIFNATLARGLHRLEQIERLFRILADAGFPDPRIPWLASMVKSYVLSFVAEEGRLTEQAAAAEAAGARLDERQEQLHRQLPAERFPTMVRLAAYTTATDWEAEFRFGLNVLLDGFAAQLGNGGDAPPNEAP